MLSKRALGLLFAVLFLTCVRPGVASPGTAPGVDDVLSATKATFITHTEALALAFPKCEIQRTTVFLKKPQLAVIAKAAQSPFTSTVVYPYIATKDSKLVGTAYFDTHRVRTLKETLMVVVDAEGKVSRIEVLAFGEPKQYIPSKKWYAQIIGLSLSPKLKLNAGVRNMTGATMTTRASVACTRRVLALHAEINKPKPKPTPVVNGDSEKETPKPSPKKKEGTDKPQPKVTPK
ncbi:MAG: hypothetical protein ACI9X4_002485 [Glaciecola sp.]|jgi:hypothetical protein